MNNLKKFKQIKQNLQKQQQAKENQEQEKNQLNQTDENMQDKQTLKNINMNYSVQYNPRTNTYDENNISSQLNQEQYQYPTPRSQGQEVINNSSQLSIQIDKLQYEINKNEYLIKIHKDISSSNIPNHNETIINTLTNMEESSNSCLICFDNAPDSVIMDCGHGGLCYKCACDIWTKSNECYLCRKEIKSILQIDLKSKGEFKQILAVTQQEVIDVNQQSNDKNEKKSVGTSEIPQSHQQQQHDQLNQYQQRQEIELDQQNQNESSIQKEDESSLSYSYVDQQFQQLQQINSQFQRSDGNNN